jgi:hypothetical protein
MIEVNNIEIYFICDENSVTKCIESLNNRRAGLQRK